MEPDVTAAERQPISSVVLDASVLFPNALRDTLLRAAEEGLFVPIWSAMILEEVRRSVVGRGRAENDRIVRTIALMQHYFPRAERGFSEELVTQMTNAPGDRHVLAVAVAARATVVVASNLRHFPASSLKPYGIVALSPDRFLCGLFDTNPAVMLGIVQRQAADLVRRPRTVEEVLTTLAKTTPAIVARIRAAGG